MFLLQQCGAVLVSISRMFQDHHLPSSSHSIPKPIQTNDMLNSSIPFHPPAADSHSPTITLHMQSTPSTLVFSPDFHSSMFPDHAQPLQCLTIFLDVYVLLSGLWKCHLPLIIPNLSSIILIYRRLMAALITFPICS